MRHTILCASLLFLNVSVFSQLLNQASICGVWQNKSQIIGAGWLDRYQFYPNGSFIFRLSEYDGAKRLIALKGHYRINKDTLFFKIETTVEKIGGSIIRDPENTLHGSWTIAKCKILEIKQTGIDESYAILSSCKKNSKLPCILIDGDEYYRIGQDPEKYK